MTLEHLGSFATFLCTVTHQKWTKHAYLYVHEVYWKCITLVYMQHLYKTPCHINALGSCPGLQQSNLSLSKLWDMHMESILPCHWTCLEILGWIHPVSSMSDFFFFSTIMLTAMRNIMVYVFDIIWFWTASVLNVLWTSHLVNEDRPVSNH